MTAGRGGLMIDYHNHILPGLDDGARDLDDALEIARLLVSAGFRTVHCTPHCIKGLYETRVEQVRQGVKDLQQVLDKEGIPLRLAPGMEYYLDEFFPQMLEDPLPLGPTRLLLVESPPGAHPRMVQDNIFLAVRRGFTPLFAHPERMMLLAPEEQKPGLLQRLTRRGRAETPELNPLMQQLQQQGCLFQGNLGSFAGYYRDRVKKRALLFQQAGVYDCFGSDAHRPEPLKWVLDRATDVLEEQRNEEMG